MKGKKPLKAYPPKYFILIIPPPLPNYFAFYIACA